MIRTPSEIEKLFDWHRRALVLMAKHKIPSLVHADTAAVPPDEMMSIQEDDPQCGFYKRRQVRGGPWIAAKIWLEQKIDPITRELTADEKLRCLVDGRDCDPFREWAGLCVRPITAEEFDFMCARADWAEESAPTEPWAKPSEPINFFTVSPPIFKKDK